MRHLGFIIVVSLIFLTCSNEDDQVNNNIISPEEYFSHVEDLTYPDELNIYAGYEDPIVFPFYNNNYPSHIISAINYLREDMGTYMDKLKPKQWWQSIDSLVIDENSATMLNSNVYIYEQSYSYNTFFTKYFQFTQNDDNQYFWLATKSNNLLNDTYDSFQINEFAWQNSLKTTGGIDRYYDPLIWRHSSDSLVVEIQSFNNSRKLSLSIRDKSGSLIRNYNDSIYIYRWNSIGKGSYLVKHSQTGLSLNPEEFW